jgi:beta-phosphoglucomutase-like phosphatase (HAD superfamily)
MESKSYKALAFDFDGTLFDTAELNYRAYKLAYYDLGVEIDKQMFRKTVGLSVYEFNNAMGVNCDVERLRELKSKYYKDLSLFAEPNEYLLNIVRTSKLPKALVTTSRLCNIEPLLEKYKLRKHFECIITQEDVRRHKPYPDAYIKATQEMMIYPEDVLAFEDTRAGFVSAREAGCDCIQIKDFEDDCVVDVTGGSDAKTKILFREDRLIVKKFAFGEGAKRLKNQYDFLAKQKKYFVNAFEPIGNENCFEYCMPYVIGVNLYEYQNKVKMLPIVMRKLNEASGKGYWNTLDVRNEIINRYIRPGIDIYNKYSARVIPYPDLDKDVRFSDYLVTNYHGDATFENIIIQRDGNIVFIDPLPDRNIVTGLLQDFAKLGQSLYGYEAIKEYKYVDYTLERKIFEQEARKYLSEMEFKSLKVHIACMFFRRLKYQEKQDASLVPVFGKIALNLIQEFNEKNYSF